MIKRKRKANKQAIIKGLAFYKVEDDNTLLVYDVILGVYAPFILNNTRRKLSSCLEWWGDVSIVNFCLLSPAKLLEYKDKGMVKIQ